MDADFVRELLAQGVFDAQVNIGQSVFGPNNDIELYLKSVKEPLRGVLFIPSPTHRTTYPTGEEEESCLWIRTPTGIVYSRTTKQEGIRIERNPANPYARMNHHIVEQAQVLGDEHPETRFFVAPKIHPKLDSPRAFDGLIGHPLVRALKIHCLATHTTPEDVPDHIITLAKEHDLPFFIHTDYVDQARGIEGINPEMYELMCSNTPRQWYEWAQTREVRAILAHGLRLDLPLLHEVSGNPRIMVALGPESLMREEKGRLYTQEGEYLDVLLSNIDPENVIYCSDYRWNIQRRGDWDSLDWQGPERVIHSARKAGLDKRDISKIVYENAEAFLER